MDREERLRRRFLGKEPVDRRTRAKGVRLGFAGLALFIAGAVANLLVPGAYLAFTIGLLLAGIVLLAAGYAVLR